MNNENTKVLDKGVSSVKEARRTVGNSAFAAGGFVAGAATASAVDLKAEESVEEIGSENVQVHIEDTAVVEELPEESEVILATDEGIRVAHVDDDVPFSAAFADARNQVGPGGVFEWQGKIYNTYYRDEWDNMSDEERADFQQSIDCDDISANSEIYTENYEESEACGVELVDAEGDSDIEVIVGDVDGMEAAIVYTEDAEMLLVDVDSDGTMDVLIADMDGDGYISVNEGVDISNENIGVDDLYVLQGGDVQYASNDSLPDYMNSADTGMYQA